MMMMEEHPVEGGTKSVEVPIRRLYDIYEISTHFEIQTIPYTSNHSPTMTFSVTSKTENVRTFRYRWPIFQAAVTVVVVIELLVDQDASPNDCVVL